MKRLVKNYSLLLSLVCALLGGAVTLYLLTSTGGDDVDKDKVVVAARGITAGKVIEAEDLEVQELPKAGIPLDAATKIDDVKGSYLVLPMVKGEVVLRSKVSTAPTGSKLAGIIPEGRVAIAVGVSDVISTGGFIAPGDRVDVLGVVSDDATDEAVIVLRDVSVIAVSNTIVGAVSGEDSKQRKGSVAASPNQLDTTVTLAVTLEEARKLVQVDEKGKLRLALRHRGTADSALRR